MPRFFVKSFLKLSYQYLIISLRAREKNKDSDTDTLNMKKFLHKNLGKRFGRKKPLFAGIPSIWMAYLPRFAKIYPEKRTLDPRKTLSVAC